jgi:hypothetical protein
MQVKEVPLLDCGQRVASQGEESNLRYKLEDVGRELYQEVVGQVKMV